MRKLVTSLVILAIVICCGLWWVSAHNRIIETDNAVKASYGDLQTELQSQAELIPNLMETVKGSAAFEKDTFTNIANARSGIISLKGLDTTNPDVQKKLIDAQAQMNQAIVKLNATKEAYPELKSSAAFSKFMVSLEGSQRRVVFARKETQRYTQQFNNLVTKIPSSWAASGYLPKPYFEAAESSQVAPKVDFNK